MATTRQWIQGARLRTLPAAIAPVLVGTGAAALLSAASLPRAALALVVALALQVGVNFANDYSDGIRGTDDNRVGPQRLVASGLVSPRRVKAAAFASFAIAAGAGLLLVAVSGTWWLLAVGAAAILAAWGYTGGRHPYGYRGLGEVGVFVFFGLVAVLGTTYTQAGQVPWQAWCGAVAIGALACAILMANNLRDRAADSAVGKRTLAVRLGDQRSRQLFAVWVIGGCAVATIPAISHPWVLIVAPTIVWSVLICRPVWAGASGLELVRVLRQVGLLELVVGVLLGIALAVS